MRYFVAVLPSAENKLLDRSTEAFEKHFASLGLCYASGDIWSGRVIASSAVFAPRAALPLPTATSGHIQIFGDVELYNRGELISRLPCCRTGAPDLEVACAYLSKFGEDSVCDFIGDFSFVLIDRAQNYIFLIRDHVGIRQLFWLEKQDIVYVSNLPSIFHCVPSSQVDLNVNSLVRLLMGEGPRPGQSYYRQINAVRPGEYISITGSNRGCKSYWIPDFRGVTVGNTEQAWEVLEHETRRAVISRLKEPEHCGVLLSGGLDSSVIAGIGASAESELRCFTGVLPTGYFGPAQDERSYVEDIQRRYPGMRTTFVDADAVKLSHGPHLAVRWLREPLRHDLFYQAHGLNLAAAAQGVRYLLNGVGGDECLSTSGSSFLRERLVHFDLFRGLDAARRESRKGRGSAAWLFALAVLQISMPEWIRLWRRRLRIPQMLRQFVLRPEVVHKLDIFTELMDDGLPPLISASNSVHHEILTTVRMRIASETMGVNFHLCGESGVVPRSPLFDWRLIETCLSVCSLAFVNQRESRRAIRHIAQKYATVGIARRADKGLFAPNVMAKFCREADEVRRLTCSAQSLPLWGELVDPNRLNFSVPADAPWHSIDDIVYRALFPSYLATFLSSEKLS